RDTELLAELKVSDLHGAHGSMENFIEQNELGCGQCPQPRPPRYFLTTSISSFTFFSPAISTAFFAIAVFSVSLLTGPFKVTTPLSVMILTLCAVCESDSSWITA